MLAKKLFLNSKTTGAGEVYEFIIDTNNSNPTSAVSYAGANASYTPASMNFGTGLINYGSWGDSFFNRLIRPVMVLYNGTVDYELNHDNFTKTLAGANSDVSNTSFGGNCMIGFPQIWMAFEYDDSAQRYQHVYIANYEVDERFHCYTHQNKNGKWLDEIYLMAYEPSNVNSVLRSLADQTILVSTAGTTMRTYAQANGSSWDFMDLGTIQMIQMLFILMFKTLDSQAAAGGGVVGGDSSTYTTTGTTKDKGMFYATDNSTSSTTPIKVFGIENLWGSRWKWINGLTVYHNTVFYKLCDYTTDGSTATGYAPTSSTPGYKSYTVSATKILYNLGMPNTSDGLMWYWAGSQATGSNSTYYCDYMYWYYSVTSSFVGCGLFGGVYDDGANAGLFCVSLYYFIRLSYSYDRQGASLSCKPL